MRLIQMPEPRLPGAYRLGSVPQYRYTLPHLARLIEYAYYAVLRKFGPGPWVPITFDFSTANGGTPHGRHPAGSHNAGNCDLSYYLTEPRADFVPGPHAGNRMTGPPRWLDAPRQAEWFLAIGRVEAAVGGQLVRLAAVDPMLEAPIDAALARLGSDDAAEQEAIRIAFSSRGGGWERFHENHMHLRLTAITNSDELAAYIERAWIAPLLAPPPAPDPLPEQPDPPAEPDPLPPPDDEQEPALAERVTALEREAAELERRVAALEARG